MRYFKVFFFIILGVILLNTIACEEQLSEKSLSFEIYEGELLDYNMVRPNTNTDSYTVEDTNCIICNEDGFLGVKAGLVKITYVDNDNKCIYTINLTVLKVKPQIVVDGSLEVGLYQTKEIEFDVINGNKEDVLFFTSITSLGLEGNTVTPTRATPGTVYLQVGDDESTKVAINVVVNDLEIVIKNDVFEVDITEEYQIDYTYPDYLNEEIVFKTNRKDIISVDEDGLVTPLGKGTDYVILTMTYNEEVIREKVKITVTVDPEKVIKALHISEVLMKKDVETIANFQYKQDVYGSVSRYFFSELNLISDIKPINENPYTGQKATKEILETVETLKKVRPGIYLEELKYIIYHDTGNNSQGADALMHSKFMVGTWNIENNRARSWHYTVDENSVYHHIPDNEVTWQGDSYESYAKSIGIETCIDYGCDLYTVWRRAGKLMASLLYKYGLTVEDIRQHYDMSGKDCPRTLRRSGLYRYALDLVAGELLYLRAMEGYNVVFESLSLDILDNTGKIIKNPSAPVEVKYKVTITNDAGYNKVIELTSKVNPVK